jgi:hypothetical protein
VIPGHARDPFEIIGKCSPNIPDITIAAAAVELRPRVHVTCQENAQSVGQWDHSIRQKFGHFLSYYLAHESRQTARGSYFSPLEVTRRDDSVKGRRQ